MHICMQNMQNGINLLKVLIFRVWRFQNSLWDAPETGQVPTSHQDSLDRASLNPRDHYPLRLKTDRLTCKSSGPGFKNDSPVPLLPGQVLSSIISWSCGNFSPPPKSGRAPLAGCVVGSESALAIFHVTLSPPPPHGTPLLLRKSGLSQRRETLALSLSSHRTLPQGFQRRNFSTINFSWDRVVSITLDPGLWKSENMLSFGPIPNIWWIKKLPLSWTSFVEKMAFILFVSQQKCFCNFFCVRYLPVSLRNASPRTFVSRSGGRSAAIRWNPPPSPGSPPPLIGMTDN